jgi:transposase
MQQTICYDAFKKEAVMARPKEVFDEDIAIRAKTAMEKLKDHKLCFRLQAIASCANQPVNTVAVVMGVSRHTIWRWAERFRNQGIEGLCDKPKGHNPAKLDKQKRRQISRWLNTGTNNEGKRVHWTIALLAHEVERVFKIKVSATSLRVMVHDMGFRQKIPRPSHAKADVEEQERFKKNSR